MKKRIISAMLALLLIMGLLCAPAAAVEDVTQPTWPAYHSTQDVLLDGKPVELIMYATGDAMGYPTNYVRVSELALALKDTDVRFSVYLFDDLYLMKGGIFKPTGNEGKELITEDQPHTFFQHRVFVNGKLAPISGLVITDEDGNQYLYFKLRDLGKYLGFNVGWSMEKGIYLETDKPYDPAD